MMPTSVSALSYPTPRLTAITGKPKTGSLRVLRRELYANARAVPSMANGIRGHLGLVMPADEYLTLTGIAFVAPPPPGNPPVVAQNTQTLMIAQQAYNDSKDVYAVYNQVSTDLKQQLLAAVNEEYIETLRDDEQGYADVPVNNILTHLFTTYGTLSSSDLVENQDKLKEAWDTTKPIASLWSKIAEIRRIAISGNAPIMDTIVIECTLTSFRATGVYARLIESWEEKEPTDQTWAAFQAHVNRHEKIRLKNASLKDAGYGTALAMDQSCLSATISADSGDTGSMSTVSMSTTKSTLSLQELSRMLPKGGGILFYCHTHGFSFNQQHTSQSCTNPGPSHDKSANLRKQMNGSRRCPFDQSNRG
jgi:hypothetical protein